MVGRRFPLLVILLLSSAISAFSQNDSVLATDEGPLSVSWEAVSGAAFYRIEMRREGLVFIETETEETELRFNLAPGAYEYRITVLTPFGSEVSVSSWQDLNVERSRIPYFRVANPQTIWEGEEEVMMNLSITELPGENEFLDFRLKRNDTDIPAVYGINEGLESVRIKTATLVPGDWDLLATAPSGLSFVHPGALIVRPKRPPEINSIDTKELPNSGLVPVLISGEAFDDEMTLAFKGEGAYLEVAALEIREGREALVYLDMDGAPAGSYNLIATNPAGENLEMESVLTVVEPDIIIKEKIQPRLGIHLGWAPTIIETPDETLPGIAVFELALAFQSGWKKPFINGLGLEARSAFGITGPTNEAESSVHYLVMFDTAIYWRPPVRGRVAPVILMGFGNMWSGYAESFGIVNMIYIRTGIGMDFARFSNFTRIGLNFMWAYSSDTAVPMVSLMFRRGFRF